MDFSPDQKIIAFRDAVQSFLKNKLPDHLKGSVRGVRGDKNKLKEWQKILQEHGWGAPAWPRSEGGTGWNAEELYIFEEECSRAGAPPLDVFGQRLLGPVLCRFGTDEQKNKHLSNIKNGECLWCQGFSEPQSGSDLASLRTEAVRHGDNYIVTGQKIWTSYAHEADWIFLLVRTNKLVKKQSGISFLLVKMDSPGVTVRPIATIDGYSHLNEVFFDQVKVPVENRIGEEGDGWAITKFLLNNEHALTAEIPAILRFYYQLKELSELIPWGNQKIKNNPTFALQLTKFENEIFALSMLVKRVISLEMSKNPLAQTLGSILKIRATELQQSISEYIVDVLGDFGALSACSDASAELKISLESAASLLDDASGFSMDMFFRRASTIYGGTSEVQKEIVSKMMFQF